jgi:transposase InsO family protein
LSEAEKVRYLFDQRVEGEKVIAICQQYGIAESTFYYWLSRHNTHGTLTDRSRAPRTTYGKVTESVKEAVIKKHKESPRLGCWRLSLFDYDGVQLSSVTIWHILNTLKTPPVPSQPLYAISRFHQIWFIDHCHLRTLPTGQKVYSLIIVDGMSRVLFSSDVIRSKSARDAVNVLIRAFAVWGMPDEIVSDNAKAFESLLFTLLLSTLEIRIRHTRPGCPWENGHAESLIGTLRSYLHPHLNRQKTVAGVARIYRDKVDYYNQRVHWDFRNDEVKTPLGKLGEVRGRQMPKNFSLEILEIQKPTARVVTKQGWVRIKRLALYVSAQLAEQKVFIREFSSNLVVTYNGSAVVTYLYEEQTVDSHPLSIDNSPLFHDNRQIPQPLQFELFDLTEFELRYVVKRPAYRRRKKIPHDAVQLTFNLP